MSSQNPALKKGKGAKTLIIKKDYHEIHPQGIRAVVVLRGSHGLLRWSSLDQSSGKSTSVTCEELLNRAGVQHCYRNTECDC